MILIRTDANATISSGHVMRCLSVADALKETGVEAVFIVSDLTAVELINLRGYEVFVLDSDWRDLERGSDVTEEIVRRYSASALLVDTYAITRDYVDKLANAVPVFYLGSKEGDLGLLSGIINYSTDIDEDAYLKTYGQRGTKLYLGPRYAPLRAAFRDNHRRVRSTVERVLVTCGNTDAIRCLPAMLDRLLIHPAASGCSFEVIIGSMFENKDELTTAFGSMSAVHLHDNVEDMASLMADCDLAVSASGTTVYELAATGVPAITFSLSPEQVSSAEKLSELEMVAYCGEAFGDVDAVARRVAEAFGRLVPDKGARCALASKAHSVIDGNGALLIANALRAI